MIISERAFTAHGCRDRKVKTLCQQGETLFSTAADHSAAAYRQRALGAGKQQQRLFNGARVRGRRPRGKASEFWLGPDLPGRDLCALYVNGKSQVCRTRPPGGGGPEGRTHQWRQTTRLIDHRIELGQWRKQAFLAEFGQRVMPARGNGDV